MEYHQKFQRIFFLGIVLTSFIFSSCSTHYKGKRFYPGPLLSKEEVSLVIFPTSACLHIIDEEGSWKGSAEILPGKHTISVGYNDGNKHSKGLFDISLDAKSGSGYAPGHPPRARS